MVLTPLPGEDTIAQALTWTFYLLIRDPDTVKKVRSELNDTFVGKQDLNLSFEPVQQSYLPYTLAVFDESLRLYPPVPFEIKQCTTPTTLPDGTFLPANAIVLWCTWAMGDGPLRKHLGK